MRVFSLLVVIVMGFFCFFFDSVGESGFVDVCLDDDLGLGFLVVRLLHGSLAMFVIAAAVVSFVRNVNALVFEVFSSFFGDGHFVAVVVFGCCKIDVQSFKADGHDFDIDRSSDRINGVGFLAFGRETSLVELVVIALDALIGKESFDTEIGLDKHSLCQKGGYLSVVLFTDMVVHVLAAFKVVDRSFDDVGPDFFGTRKFAESFKIFVYFVVIERLSVDQIFFDKTVDDVVGISSDRRSEVAVLKLGKTEMSFLLR